MKLTIEQIEKIKEIRSLLFGSFPWSRTEQGMEYWDKVYDNLEEMINIKECPHCGKELEDE